MNIYNDIRSYKKLSDQELDVYFRQGSSAQPDVSVYPLNNLVDVIIAVCCVPDITCPPLE